MVCKEEVLLWFKDLHSYKRIDVLYELLNMCLPFELRFIGSCVEEIGKHTYQELRGPTLTANDYEKLCKDVSLNQGLLDESVRHRVLIYLSLLTSRNYSVANWMYKHLLRTDYIENYLVKEKGKDEELHTEFLLLFTMALHHPAFTFEHKQFFSKILTSLIDFKENRVSAKHCALGYPPGFGYPTQKIHDIPIPVKTVPTSCGDPPTAFHQQPPGLQHMTTPPHIDFMTALYTRPGFPYGAPEVPPFPAPSISPLVSQAASPNQSRSTSPHRTPMSIRPPPPSMLQQPPPGPPPNISLMNGPPPPIDVMTAPVHPQIPMDQLSQSSLPMYSNPDLKMTEDDLTKLSSIAEENRLLWPHQGPINPEVKPNGIRFPTFGRIKPFLIEHMQALNLDAENVLHLSNSSSNSSPNETPPGTPANTPNTTPHGPGRGENKPRLNGMPQFSANPGPPIHDTTSPPPPPQAFSNSPVPSYNYSQPFPTMPPNRSMFPYTQGYRPTFTPFSNFSTDNSFPTYNFPYPPFLYSSPYPPRTPPGCFNCGAPNHIGNECTNQNIEEITQKKAYMLEYSSPPPDAEK